MKDDKLGKATIELRKVVKVPNLLELVAQITPENQYEETDCGPAVGKEKIRWS